MPAVMFQCLRSRKLIAYGANVRCMRKLKPMFRLVGHSGRLRLGFESWGAEVRVTVQRRGVGPVNTGNALDRARRKRCRHGGGLLF